MESIRSLIPPEFWDDRPALLMLGLMKSLIHFGEKPTPREFHESLGRVFVQKYGPRLGPAFKEAVLWECDHYLSDPSHSAMTILEIMEASEVEDNSRKE